MEEQARGPGDNGTPLTPSKRKHVYGFSQEMRVNCGRNAGVNLPGTLIGCWSVKSQLEKFMPMLVVRGTRA